jgi:transcriptional regulator with XRE-family HTH domain
MPRPDVHKITELMHQSGMTRAHLADSIGVSRGYITLILQSQRTNVGVINAFNISNELGVPITDIFSEINDIEFASIDLIKQSKEVGNKGNRLSDAYDLLGKAINLYNEELLRDPALYERTVTTIARVAAQLISEASNS